MYYQICNYCVNYIDPAFGRHQHLFDEVDVDRSLNANDGNIHTIDVIHPILCEIEHNKIVADLDTMKLTTEMQLGLDDLFRVNGC